MDHKSSGHFNISDPLGVQLHLLSSMCAEGSGDMCPKRNGYAAWLAYRLCREEGRPLPDWLTAYLDEAADFILGQYTGPAAALVIGLSLSRPESQRLEAVGPVRPSEKLAQWQAVAKAMLPRFVDDYASERGVAVQTAIKELAPSLGFAGDQWTKLRDAYNAARRHLGK